jgi:heme-degrading monooxygenase HmoA
VTAAETAAGLYTLINVFRVDPAWQDALADRVLRTARMAAALDGFAGATVFASTDGTRVVNYARWTDEDAFARFVASARSELAEAVSLGEPDGHPYRVAGHVPPAGGAR